MEKLLLIHSTKEIQLQVKNVASRLKLALDIIPDEYCGCRLKELAAGKYAQNPLDATPLGSTTAEDVTPLGSTAAEDAAPSGNAAAEGTVPAQVNAGASGAESPSSLLVLCGLRDKRLDKALFELRRADIPIDYKAILTPSNQEWTVPELMKELQRERQAMGR